MHGVRGRQEEAGSWRRGPMGGSEEEKGKDRARGRENLENKTVPARGMIAQSGDAGQRL